MKTSLSRASAPIGLRFMDDWDPPTRREVARLVDDLREIHRRLEDVQDFVGRWHGPAARWVTNPHLERDLAAVTTRPGRKKRAARKKR